MPDEPTPDRKPECLERWAHKWQWIWEGAEWTQTLRCVRCGETREANRNPEQIVEEGK